LDGIELDITKSATHAIAKKAIKLKTNARGLKSILDKLLLPYQFDSTEMKKRNVEKIQINQDVVDNSSDPVLFFKNEGKIAKTKK